MVRDSHSAKNNDYACTYEVLECSSVYNVLDSEDNGTVVPYHIHVSYVELNVSSVYMYFHICNKESVLFLTADDHGDRFLRWD
jgi:hypothetical protein